MVTIERLCEVLAYDSATGLFTWKVATGRRVKVGQVAGTPHDGYTRIRIDGKAYRAHILAWFYHHKVWPSDLIDHENCVRTDNRIDNLRIAGRSNNNKNKTIYSNNTSGVKGVGLHRGKYRARVELDGVVHEFTGFETLSEAEEKVKEVRLKLHGDYANHGA